MNSRRKVDRTGGAFELEQPKQLFLGESQLAAALGPGEDDVE